MKAVILSLRPQWCEKIFNGSKTIEVRKSRPSIPTPFTVYVYMTKHKWIFKLLPFLKNRFAKVIGSFVCDRVRLCIPFGLKGHLLSQEVYREMCLTKEQLDKYGGLKTLYGWHITEPKLFDKPRDITEFALYGKCADECSEYDFCARDDEDDRVRDNCFKRTFLKRPPQAYCFIETNEN